MKKYKKFTEGYKIVNTKAIQLNDNDLLLGEDGSKGTFYIKNKYGIIEYTKNELKVIYDNNFDFDLLRKI
jgi:hypothetical protein